MFLSTQYLSSDSRGDPVAEWEQRTATALYITKARGFEPGWSGAETRRKWGQALNPALMVRSGVRHDRVLTRLKKS